jgi:hypothetical protein
MLFLTGKEDMGLEASFKLLDLPPEATIDDANQAYGYLHRMIDLYHRNNGAGERGNRQEDMDLLNGAYEKAVAYLSTAGPGQAPSTAIEQPGAAVPEDSAGTNLHFTINFSADPDENDVPDTAGPLPLPAPNTQTIQEAVAIIAHRLQETEAALPAAQRALETAASALDKASRRCEIARQARLNAVVAAKSAKARALLLEIEAKRAMKDAIVVAQKAQERVVAAKDAAKAARADADKAREQAGRVRKSEETTAAEAVCAEDRLEKAKARLKTLTLRLVETRNRMKIFTGTEGIEKDPVDTKPPFNAMTPEDRFRASRTDDQEASDRQHLMADLLEIEATLQAKKRNPPPVLAATVSAGIAAHGAEKRMNHRLIYPPDKRPLFSIGNRLIPILDLSSAGMRVVPDDAMARMRIVRGVIAFAEQPPIKVAGRVVRQDDSGLGLRLVTRIGNHVIDQERRRLNT